MKVKELVEEIAKYPDYEVILVVSGYEQFTIWGESMYVEVNDADKTVTIYGEDKELFY